MLNNLKIRQNLVKITTTNCILIMENNRIFMRKYFSVISRYFSGAPAARKTVGGSRRTRREPAHTQGEHADSTERPQLEVEPGTLCREATVLITTPPC